MNTNDKEYIQFSKRVTRWGMILIGSLIVVCLGIIALCDLPQYSVNAVVSLYTSFATVLGVMVGAYQGNSSLEKWTKAKYQIGDTDFTLDDTSDAEPNG